MRCLRYLPQMCAISLGMAAVLFLEGCSRSTAETPTDETAATNVGVVAVTRKDLSRSVVLTAEFRPYEEVDLHAKVAGYVQTIRVDIGDRVRKGELIATLEVPELQDEIKQAQAMVRQAEAELARAQDDLQRSESAHQVAHLAYGRLAEVLKSQPNLIAQQEVDDAMGRDRVSEAQVSASKSAVSAAQQHLEVGKASLNKLQTLYAYSNITAPFDGVITKRYADPGAMIQAGTASQTQTMPVVRLSRNERLRLIVPVPESAVPRIKVGAVVHVRIPTLGKSIQGKVTRFSNRLDLDTRTMQTEIDVPNPTLELVPGMYAEAAITIEKKNNVLAVPVQALDHHQGKAEVFRVTPDGRVEVVPVKTGLEDPANAEIISGLKEHDQVIISGRGQLRTGEKVRPKMIEAPSGQGDS